MRLSRQRSGLLLGAFAVLYAYYTLTPSARLPGSTRSLHGIDRFHDRTSFVRETSVVGLLVHFYSHGLCDLA